MPKILIVEDNPVLQIGIQRNLEKALKKFYSENSIAFKLAATGKEALENASDDLYMVIMNSKLKDKMSGAEIYIRLCKIYPGLEDITIGWSDSHTFLESWNNEIKAKYESQDIPPNEKPLNLPQMKHFLIKRALPEQIAYFIETFENIMQKKSPQSLSSLRAPDY